MCEQDEVAVVEEQEKVLAEPTFSEAVTPQQPVPGARIKKQQL